MRLALDTNRYADLARGHEDVLTLVQDADEVWLPLIVLAELRAGFVRGQRSLENERVLRRFLGEPGVGVLVPDQATTHTYAALYLQLRAQGTPIPTNDLWIAALVVQHGLVLMSQDRHFGRLGQIKVV